LLCLASKKKQVRKKPARTKVRAPSVEDEEDDYQAVLDQLEDEDDENDASYEPSPDRFEDEDDDEDNSSQDANQGMFNCSVNIIPVP
jgi:hypothetical protein